MSKGWAAIVYGRSYHLDFRFITVPYDFTGEDLNWASQYIIATTQQARNLAGSPRWSLFKNDCYCVVGVTCMVRDLIELNEDLSNMMTKDDQNRPLYIFVGYVTQLKQGERLQNFPNYSGLSSFKVLYQAVKDVWLIKNYDPQSTRPQLSYYQLLNFPQHQAAVEDKVTQINHALKDPDKIYLWSNSTQQNSLLWQASAQCFQSTATCLNIKGKALINSPFINQTSSQTKQEEQIERGATVEKDRPSDSPNNLDPKLDSSLSQKIGNRAKEDIDLTIQQAAKMAIASQELINSFTDRHDRPSETDEQLTSDSSDETEFGFKSKKSESPTRDRNWF